MPSAMKKKSAKRYYKKRNNSKMSSQDFSRKLMKALNKAMTRKKMMFGGNPVNRVLKVDIVGGENKSVKVNFDATNQMPTKNETQENKGFSDLSQIYTNGGTATAYMDIIFDDGKDDTNTDTTAAPGEPKTFKEIKFDSTVFEKSV